MTSEPISHSSRTVESALETLVMFYETMTPESLVQLPSIYATDAYFKDPFNEVTGIAPIKAIFAHMFVQVAKPKFTVLSAIASPPSNTAGHEAYIVWLFDWGKEKPIRGSSHIKFDSHQRVIFHRDYWDAAEELYETLPLLGTLMRWLKGKLSLKQTINHNTH